MQGRRDYPLSPLGRSQAERLAAWLVTREVRWDAAYSSPLLRAKDTGELLARHSGGPAPVVLQDLAEVHAGSLEGMTRSDMEEQAPAFLRRDVSSLAEFAEFGGESYEDVQARVERVIAFLERAHRAPEERVLLVAHGGINFQLLKRLVCLPVPRLCIVRMGNCSATMVRMRDRRGTWLGEITWHVPLELMGGVTGDGSASLFR